MNIEKGIEATQGNDGVRDWEPSKQKKEQKQRLEDIEGTLDSLGQQEQSNSVGWKYPERQAKSHQRRYI